MRPRCRWASGSVRKSPKTQSAKAPRLAQVFWPFRTQEPSARALGPGADGGQIGAGVGLGPALAPDGLGRGHGRQEAGLLVRGAELEEGGGQEEDPVLGDPGGGPGPVVLLLEDEPLHEPHVAATELLGPGDDRPAGVVHGLLPGPVGLEAVGRVQRGQRAPTVGPGGDVVLQPGPRLETERFLVVGEAEVHGPSNLTHRQIRGNNGLAVLQGGSPCPTP